LSTEQHHRVVERLPAGEVVVDVDSVDDNVDDAEQRESEGDADEYSMELPFY
jgi:hypothetical protein